MSEFLPILDNLISCEIMSILILRISSIKEFKVSLTLYHV